MSTDYLTDVAIRPAVSCDLPIITHMTCALAQETERYTPDPKHVARIVAMLLAEPALRANYWLAVRKNQIAGMCLTWDQPLPMRGGFCPWLDDVYVLPSYRKQKICRRLLAHIRQDLSLRSDVIGQRLMIMNDNQRALTTYEKYDFKLDGHLVMSRWP